MSRFTVSWSRFMFWTLVVVSSAMGLAECYLQHTDSEYVRRVAWDIVERAQAADPESRVLALRDYLRAHVDFKDAPYDERPFLRASAGDTLRSGKGYCGEVTRAFVNLAAAVGIPAQRINLWGKRPHVVAEAEIGSERKVIVDSQSPPIVADLEPLTVVLERYDYSDYYTLNLRRLHLGWLLSRLKLEMGPLTYWTERPHGIKAALWFTFTAVLLCTVAGLRGTRAWLRWHLRRRGWIHISNHQALQAAALTSVRLHTNTTAAVASLEKVGNELRCPGCRGLLSWLGHANGMASTLRCRSCQESFPVVNGIPRMLLPPLREALLTPSGLNASACQKVSTAMSFGYEWNKFPEMREEWEKNFLDYMAPYGPNAFLGKRVLDVGCGSGRHAYYAAKYGADVWAVDLSDAVEVARRNTADQRRVHVVQADLHHLPFAPESFDLIYSIGVLHHLADPETAFRNLLRFLKPGGLVVIYVYWDPEAQPLKRALLTLVTAVRAVTTQLPYGVIRGLSYPAAVAAFLCFVWPYQILRHLPGLCHIAERMPMKQYADYPFGVCVNDQFDRLSAPIEHRFTKEQVERWLRGAGLDQIAVWPRCGWGGSGRKPAPVPVAVNGRAHVVTSQTGPLVHP